MPRVPGCPHIPCRSAYSYLLVDRNFTQHSRYQPRCENRIIMPLISKYTLTTVYIGVSSDLSKCFLRGVPRTHSHHATV